MFSDGKSLQCQIAIDIPTAMSEKSEVPPPRSQTSTRRHRKHVFANPRYVQQAMHRRRLRFFKRVKSVRLEWRLQQLAPSDGIEEAGTVITTSCFPAGGLNPWPPSYGSRRPSDVQGLALRFYRRDLACCQPSNMAGRQFEWRSILSRRARFRRADHL